jgi:hypothetical protein
VTTKTRKNLFRAFIALCLIGLCLVIFNMALLAGALFIASGIFLGFLSAPSRCKSCGKSACFRIIGIFIMVLPSGRCLHCGTSYINDNEGVE